MQQAGYMAVWRPHDSGLTRGENLRLLGLLGSAVRADTGVRGAAS